MLVKKLTSSVSSLTLALIPANSSYFTATKASASSFSFYNGATNRKISLNSKILFTQSVKKPAA